MDTKHTPGPYTIRDTDLYWRDAVAIQNAEGEDIAITTRGFEDGPSWANAALLAAAPDLLTMCEAWVAEWSGFSADELHRRARMGFEVSHLNAETVSRILATRAAIALAKEN